MSLSLVSAILVGTIKRSSCTKQSSKSLLAFQVDVAAAVVYDNPVALQISNRTALSEHDGCSKQSPKTVEPHKVGDDQLL